MSVIFLTEQGAQLCRQGKSFVLKKDGKPILLFPAAGVRQLVVFGRVEITTAMVQLLLKEGIETTFLTRDGRFLGRLVGDTSKNVLLRDQQFERARDARYCLEFARAITAAKAKNALRMIYKRDATLIQDFARRAMNFRKNLEKVDSLQQVRGLEGAFSALYFRLFPQLLVEDYGFRRRLKHPPPDPVNVLLSFGYTLLFQNLYSLILAAGLDPFRGFYHQLHYGHPALVSDLMEEFRAPVVDSLVIRLINLRQITGQDFEEEENQIRLRKEAIETLVTAYRERLNTTITLKKLSYSILQILQHQVQVLVRSIQTGEPYKPFEYP